MKSHWETKINYCNVYYSYKTKTNTTVNTFGHKSDASARYWKRTRCSWSSVLMRISVAWNTSNHTHNKHTTMNNQFYKIFISIYSYFLFSKEGVPTSSVMTSAWWSDLASSAVSSSRLWGTSVRLARACARVVSEPRASDANALIVEPAEIQCKSASEIRHVPSSQRYSLLPDKYLQWTCIGLSVWLFLDKN